MTEQERDKLTKFFLAEVIPPPRHLVGVRDLLLGLGHKRWPMWRFRLAADLVCEIQPQKQPLAYCERPPVFRGRAVCVADAGMADLKKRPDDRPGSELSFFLFGQGEAWTWRAARYAGSRRVAPEHKWEVRSRVIAAFQCQMFDMLDRDFLLQPACLVCSKPLTDPASMARLIGPECAGSASQAGVILWNLGKRYAEHIRRDTEDAQLCLTNTIT